MCQLDIVDQWPTRIPPPRLQKCWRPVQPRPLTYLPENGMWHIVPSWAVFVPHVNNIHKKAMSQLNHLEDIGQGQRSLCAPHQLMLVMICAKYGNNPARSVHVADTRCALYVPYFSRFIAKSWINDLEDTRSRWKVRYRLRSTVIVCDIPSHASDHLCPTRTESNQKCTCCRADTARSDIF